MITITGFTQRSFLFPADLATAFEYYNNIRRTFSFLSHIYLIHNYSELQYRLAYSATELGIYHVQLICDIRTEADRENWVLRIIPLEGMPPVVTEVGVNSLSSQGYYASESIFSPAGDQTEIDYTLKIIAHLPIPYGARLIPASVLDKVANNITGWRIEEIAEGFIERSVQFYLAQQAHSA
jgi:hypothetical protein